jgi:hypothetical protein
MSNVWTGFWNEWHHPRHSPADRISKKKKRKEDREAKLAVLEDTKIKEQPMADKKVSISTSSELPDANILQRMREMLIESDISGDTYIRASVFA